MRTVVQWTSHKPSEIRRSSSLLIDWHSMYPGSFPEILSHHMLPNRRYKKWTKVTSIIIFNFLYIGVWKGGSGNPKSKFQTAWNPKSNFQTDPNPKSKFQKVKFKFQYPKSRFQRPENPKSKFQRAPKSQIQISNDKNPKSEIAFHPPIYHTCCPLLAFWIVPWINFGFTLNTDLTWSHSVFWTLSHYKQKNRSIHRKITKK